ncbi:ABC transporter substrate-binding protein [Rhodobacterales bacterium HKCCE3408]|nr:ABC transporter substrate-binding protein [Rhodobacterales bacterium HKCCE3408]
MSHKIIARHALAALAAATAATPLAAQDLTPVTYGTNWVAQAEHGGFYQAVADGTYEECGLDVEILPGGPQVNNQALLLAGRIDFYMGGTLDAFFGVAEGLPLVNVAAMFQKDPQVILTHPGRVSSFAELASPDITMIVQDGATYYEWMKAAYGFTDEQRQPYTFNSAPFIVNEDAGQQGYLSSEPYFVELETGWAPDVYLIADAGYAAYSTTIQATAETVETRPEVVQCFVDGSIIGWYNYIYGDNSAANAMILEDNPDMTQEAIDYAIEVMIAQGIVDSGDTMELGIGAMTDERMQAFYDSMVEAGVIEGGLDISTSYSLDFVNNGVGMDLRP